MDSPLLPRRQLLFALAASPLAWPIDSQALCASPAESGRWRNIDPQGDPAVIDLRMTDCGDEVLNGEQTQTRYQLRVWVRQSSGQYYGRPPVAAGYHSWKGGRWMVGRVPTGGYVDNMWMQAMRQGERKLHVLIKHESLDSKPSSTTEHWFRYEKAL